MGLAELLRKTVLGAALAFSSGSAGCTKPNFRESRVAAEQGLTNQQGEVSFSNQVVAQVQDGTAQLPLENMVVHYLHTSSENTLLAIDPQGNYYPNLASFASGDSAERRRRKPRKIIIELDQFQEGMGAGQAIVDAFTYQGGDILGEDENYFKYCLSMEDILTSTIDIPAGIILIAPKLVYGEIAEFVASAGTALLKDIVNTFIVAEYGQQPGYEVHSPKRAMSICGEEYEDIICDISGDKLRQLWSPDLPYWHIVGGCTPKPKDGGNSLEKIVFVNGHNTVFTINPKGGELKLIKDDCFTPSWSPDGTRIALNCHSDPKSIYIINVDGTNFNKLAEYGTFGLAWSPLGNKIVFAAAASDLYLIDLDGNSVTPLTQNTGGDVWDPSWSPDATRIAFHHAGVASPYINYDIYVVNADGSNMRNLTNTPGYFEYNPAWSPDGNKIAYGREYVGDGNRGDISIYLMDSDGTNQQPLIEPLDGDDYIDPAWSPDGKKLAFVSVGVVGTIYIFELSSGTMTRLVDNGWEPDWFP